MASTHSPLQPADGTRNAKDVVQLVQVLDASGNVVGSGADQEVVGNVASGATDSGNPVKTGGKYNTSAPTLTNGQRGDLQLDAAANLLVSLATKIAGEDITNDVQKVEQRFSFTNIVSATTTVVKSGAGFLHLVNLGTTAAGAITIYDNTAGSGTKIGILKASIVEGTYRYDVSFATGLTIVTAAASDLTVSYR